MADRELTESLMTDKTGRQILKKLDDVIITMSSSDIIDMVYPIGSIYMSRNSTSPASLFGGTWVQIKDKFLMTYGDTYTQDGGSATATLQEENLPSHSHSFTPSGTVSVTSNPSFTGTNASGTLGRICSPNSSSGVFSITSMGWTNTRSGNNLAFYNVTFSMTPAGSISGGTYTFSGTEGTTEATGSGDSFSILPPFEVVYAWERTA